MCLQIPSDVSKIFSDDACVNNRESVSTMLLDRTCFSVVVVVVIVDFFHTKFSSQIKLGGLSIKRKINETLYVRLVENDNIFEVQSLIICILKE